MVTSFNGRRTGVDPLLEALAWGEPVDYDVLVQASAYRRQLQRDVDAFSFDPTVHVPDLKKRVVEQLRLEIDLLASAQLRAGARRAA